MFSFHPNKIDKDIPSKYAYGFKSVNTDDPEIIARICTTFVHSGICWESGNRSKSNFLCSNWIMLDFDNGAMTVEQAIVNFQEYTHVIATSRNHRKQKGDTPPCDRFHVYLQLTITETNGWNYENILRYYSRGYDTDPAAGDSARMFFPCNEVVSFGKGVEIEAKILETEVLKNKKKRVFTRDLGKEYAPSTLHKWAQDLLEHGPEGGASRNTTCFKVGIQLKRIGKSENEAVEILMNSAIPVGPEVVDEVRAAVASAYRYY